jgi:hypothetical protein
MAYAPNVRAAPENRQVLSDGWFKYFGFRIPPEQITCDGCLAEKSQPIDRDCPVRPCVLQRELENCAACGEYVCEKLKERLVVFEEVRCRAGTDIPPEDRERFIRPYENQVRLEELRKAS